MTTQTAPTKQITPYENLVSMVRSDDVRARFEDVLGANARAFLASLLTLANSDNLKDCEPRSVLVAAMKAATLGLPVDPAIGQAWIIGYWNNKHKRREAQFQPGYKGIAQLAMRTHEYERINLGEVYKGQEVKQDQLTGEVNITGIKDPTKPVVGFFAFYRLFSGFEDFRYMTVEEIIEHAQHYSPSWKESGSAWHNEHEFPKMAKKTVLKRLLNSGVAPLSVDLKQALKEEENGEAAEEEGIPLGEAGEVIEGEAKDVTSDQPVPPEPEEIKVDPAPSGVAQVVEILKIDAAYAAQILERKDDTCELEPVVFVKAVLGWMDMGDTLEKAAKAVNEGKVPR